MRILLLAPDLLGESLALQLTTEHEGWEVMLRGDQSALQPSIVIWSIDAVPSFGALQHEVLHLQDRWQPAPLLLLLPATLQASRDQLLALPAAGLLQNADFTQVQNAIKTLIGGGRVVQLEPTAAQAASAGPAMGLGQWLLVSGLHQISNDLQVIEALLMPPPDQWMLRLVLEGRCRELRSARSLLLWLWGPCRWGWRLPFPCVRRSLPLR